MGLIEVKKGNALIATLSKLTKSVHSLVVKFHSDELIKRALKNGCQITWHDGKKWKVAKPQPTLIERELVPLEEFTKLKELRRKLEQKIKKGERK